MKPKTEIWKLSPTEFMVLYALSQNAFSLNPNQIHRDVLFSIVAILFNIAHNHTFSRKDEQVIRSYSVIVHAQSGSPFVAACQNMGEEEIKATEKMMALYKTGDSKSMRLCEKMLRKYADMPSYDRIVRSLAVLKKENLVSSRDSGKGVVWSLPPESKTQIIQYASTLKITESFMDKLFK